MQGWLSILIMITLGAGFAVVAIGLSSVLRTETAQPEKSALMSAACRRSATPGAAVGQVLPRGDDLPIFDIEVAFLYPWAMALRDLGWNGFIQLVLFFRCSWPDTFTSGAKRPRLGQRSGRAPMAKAKR
jgi:NADH-quinone oxidoreductase subunit A